MENSAEYFTLIELVKVLGGTSIVLVALITFIGKIWLNRIQIKDKARVDKQLKKLENSLNSKVNALKAKNETKVHVHKIQFEKEFSEYQELWKKAVYLDKILRSLIESSSDFDGYDKTLKEYYCSFNDLVDYNLNSHPFYHKSVHSSSASMMVYIQGFHSDLIKHKDYLNALGTELEDDFQEYNSDLFDKWLKELAREFGNEMIKLSGAIRERWQSMVLIENDL